jgi:hypothetical protein
VAEAVSKSCPQCGAAVDLPPEQIASLCAFCDSPLVDGEGATERIDLVAPFDLEKKVAGSLLAQHLQDHWFIPESLRHAGKPEELRGVLVPFWCYDATARSEWTARQGIHWYRTERYTKVENGRTVTRTRQVRETEWFGTSGTHVATYTNHLVSGSRGLSEPEANELEPFDVGGALPCSPGLLAGWTAERPTVPRGEAADTASQELAELENAAIAGFLPADAVRDVTNRTEMEVGALKLVMLPVWVGTYPHADQVLRLLVNGQTGEVVAKLPKSWPKIIALVLAIVAALSIFVCGVLGILALAGEL